MTFELLVIGLLLYGLAYLGLAMFHTPVEEPAAESPDRQDAPIFVRRGADRDATDAIRRRTRQA